MRKIKIMENTFCYEAAKWLTPSNLLKKKKNTLDQNLAVCSWERKYNKKGIFQPHRQPWL